MELLCITDASKKFDISSKTLRYYENVGILKPIRMEDNKYRYYDDEAVERIKQILILRKMQISIKDIVRIFENEDMSTVVEVFVERIIAIDEQVGALSELKSIINEFLQTMFKNGITKISALPLLYDEMDKQLTVLEKQKSITYDNLSMINEKLAHSIDISIIILPKMRVLTSCLKTDGNSDTDVFWQWINDNNIDYGIPGSHILFEQQADDGQVMVVKIPDDFDNTSPFTDYIWDGGLFASASVYVDDDIHQSFLNILKSFDNNKYYEIDYTHDGKLRDNPLIETIISPDELREKIDIFVPVKKRLADISYYNDEKQTALEIKPIEIEKANPIGKLITVNLKEINHIGIKAANPISENKGTWDYKFYEYNDNGEIELHSYLLARQLESKEKIKIPFMIEIDCRIPNPENELRICHDLGHIEIRFSDGNIQITIREPIFGVDLEHKHIASNNVIFGQDANIKWVVGEKYFAVIINGEIKYCGINYAYMQIDRNTFKEHPARIAAAGNESVIIKSIKLYSVVPEKINKLKKGDLKMVTKQSNNILPNLHKLVTYHYGENYNFNACMRMLMEYAEPNELYSYSFFAGISGDNFVQVYGQKEQYENYNGSLSCVWDGQDLTKYIFNEIGYEYAYITAEQIAANKSMYVETIKAFIDKGLPVIFKQDRGWHPIVGYEENGKVLLFMDGENTEPNKMTTEWNPQDKEHAQDWIFIGEKKKEIDCEQIYINALVHIAELLESPDKYGCSFGIKAFCDWADDIENGRFDGMKQEEFDGWKYYSVYICNMSTNFCTVSYDFLNKAKVVLPQFSTIDAEYSKVGETGFDLQSLGGNFNVTLENLQDKQKRAKITEALRAFAPGYENFARYLKNTLGV